MTVYREWPGALSGTTLWCVAAGGDEEGHRVLPDAAMDLMWCDGLWTFAGPDTTALVVPSRPGSSTWGLRLGPGMAHTLLGIPADHLTDQRLPVREVAPLSSELVDQAHTSPAEGR